MTLADWHKQVSQHLQMIEAGAEMSARLAGRLVGMPGWETKAIAEIITVEEVLVRALAHFCLVRQQMESKPHVD